MNRTDSLKRGKKLGLIGKLFCLLIVILGVSEIVVYAPVAFKGTQLAQSGETVNAQIVDKQIERPGPRRKPSLESVSVNGTKVRGLRTYFNQYVLTVQIAGPDGAITSNAPVSYDQWHKEQVGQSIEVSMVSGVSDYVDANNNTTLFYALHNMAFGVLMIGVGLIAMRLPDGEET